MSDPNDSSEVGVARARGAWNDPSYGSQQGGGFARARNVAERTGNAPGINTALQSKVIVQEVNVPTMLELTYKVDALRGSWLGANLNEFKPGFEISRVLSGVSATLPDKFYVSAVTLDAKLHGESTARVTAFDAMHFLRFGTHIRGFVGKTDESIVSEVVKSAGLSVRVQGEGAKKIQPYVVQDNETNYDFLMKRCAQANYELIMGNNILIYRPAARGEKEKLTLTYRQDIEEINLDLRTPQFGSSVLAIGYDVAKGALVSTKSDDADDLSTDKMGGQQIGYTISKNKSEQDSFPSSDVTHKRPDLSDSSDLKSFAQALRERYLNSFITGTAKLVMGAPSVTAGINVQIKGLSDRFNGLYYVVKSVQTATNGQYTSVIDLCRSGI